MSQTRRTRRAVAPSHTSEEIKNPQNAVDPNARLAYPVALIQALGDYLLTRPMGEVRGFVQALETQGVAIVVKQEEQS